MRTVTEIGSSRHDGNAYLLIGDDGKERVISHSSASGEADGVPWVVIYDPSLDICLQPSIFLSEEYRWDSPNTLAQATSAMKLLLTFCEVVGIPFEEFDLWTARSFLEFVRGTLSDGTSVTFRLRTARSEQTVSSYLRHYRRYARHIGCDSSPFLQRGVQRWGRHPMGGASEQTWALSSRVAKSHEAPMYLTVGQYQEVLRHCGGIYGGAERVICRLMFEHGLRIGEVLGLTIEDVGAVPGRDAVMRFSVTLRNRASDAKWQRAKSVIGVTSREAYSSPGYGKRNVGYQRVYISGSLFGEITSYADTVHPSDGAIADSVRGSRNEYLILNTAGRPLSSSSWNRRLRVIMTACGIEVDDRTRQTNLNHRFRHGYAMFLSRECRKDDFEVMTLMRHRSLKSTEAYHNPTEEDVRVMQEEVLRTIEERVISAGGQTWAV